MIASRLAGMRPPYPRYPLREFTPCAPGRSIQQYFPVSSGTGSRIEFLQCKFHPRRPTGITIDYTDLTDNVRTMSPEKHLSYPRSPLREFTPCAPGRSTASCQEANPVRRRSYPPHPKLIRSLFVVSRRAGTRCSLLVASRRAGDR